LWPGGDLDQHEVEGRRMRRFRGGGGGGREEEASAGVKILVVRSGAAGG